MPLYEYQCNKCGRVVEALQRMSDDPLKRCDELGDERPGCDGGGDLEKVMSRTSFVLKGDGWYITDYARKGQKDGKSSKGGDGGGSESKSSSSKGDTGGSNKAA